MIHAFNFKLNGLVRAFWHLCAGIDLLGSRAVLFPSGVNSMTTAKNYHALMRDMEPPKTIIDVGANNSQMVKLIASKDAKVISFEPNPNLFPIGEVHRIALGNKDDLVTLFVPKDSTWGTTVQGKIDAPCEKKKVVMRSFASLIKRGELNPWEMPGPTLLKVDTEGNELEVLRGIGEYFSLIDYVLLEITNSNQIAVVYQLLKEKGFNASRVLYAAHDGHSVPNYFDTLFWRMK